MAELDQWIDSAVVQPLLYGDDPTDPNARSLQDIADQVFQAIRDKVLESYRNGQKAGAAKPVRKGAAMSRLDLLRHRR